MFMFYIVSTGTINVTIWPSRNRNTYYEYLTKTNFAQIGIKCIKICQLLEHELVQAKLSYLRRTRGSAIYKLELQD